jgi:outer membrane protein assembly factor BamB
MVRGPCVLWGREDVRHALCILLSLILLVSAPASAEIVLFVSGSDQISSLGVIDIAEDIHGTLYFGTDNGLSIYNGTWHIIHMTHGNASTGLLDDHVLALEFDPGGNLWMGFPDGLQRIEGGAYVAVLDQQLLKSLDIHGLLLANGKMWVATGTAGVHRYQNGVWEWFRPQGSEGLGCNYVTSMAADPTGETVYMACNEGIWFTKNTGEPVAFTSLTGTELLVEPGITIRSDPLGGIFIFNASAILHYAPPRDWNMIVSSQDLSPGISISDVTVDPDGTFWIATNNGIYAWKDGKVREHLDTGAGIRNNAVKMLYIDAEDRLWFVTPENVGFSRIIRQTEVGNPLIPITTFSLPNPVPSPGATPFPRITPAVFFSESPEAPAAAPSSPLADILNAIAGFLGRALPH